MMTGSIPAWAGETIIGVRSGIVQAVYPRVGGGNGAAFAWSGQDWGLSPRGRGKRIVNPPGKRRVRSIPAWAGETNLGRAEPTEKEVYPRVGGGNGRRRGMNGGRRGLSPRGRGKRTK